MLLWPQLGGKEQKWQTWYSASVLFHNSGNLRRPQGMITRYLIAV